MIDTTIGSIMLQVNTTSIILLLLVLLLLLLLYHTIILLLLLLPSYDYCYGRGPYEPSQARQRTQTSFLSQCGVWRHDNRAMETV